MDTTAAGKSIQEFRNRVKANGLDPAKVEEHIAITNEIIRLTEIIDGIRSTIKNASKVGFRFGWLFVFRVVRNRFILQTQRQYEALFELESRRIRLGIEKHLLEQETK